MPAPASWRSCRSSSAGRLPHIGVITRTAVASKALDTFLATLRRECKTALRSAESSLHEFTASPKQKTRLAAGLFLLERLPCGVTLGSARRCRVGSRST